MAEKIFTPGVYINEGNAFTGSVIALPTAIPVFIGYTEVAEWNGKSLLEQPTRITSFAEYTARFGGGLKAKFSIADPEPGMKQDSFTIKETPKVVKINEKYTAYLFNAIRLFYANGGGTCYILAVNTYGGSTDGLEIKVEDFTGSPTKADPFEILKKEYEPTLIVMPDAIALGQLCYAAIYTKALAHCSVTQSRFAILDLIRQEPADSTTTLVTDFREKIGAQALNCGAAYYPWLKATVVEPAEVSFENLDSSVDLEHVLAEAAAIETVKKFKTNKTPDDESKKIHHQTLKALSPTYNILLNEICFKWNELPPSGAIAGLYAMVDTSRGVWKSPANISVNAVNAPTVNISQEEQERLNVDVVGGKSINVIRTFPGVGTLIWGARTLDGNSQDWRYINVRRTLIMIEQSLKLACRAYVFESNDAGTWITVKSMAVSFLTGLWKQGALAGAAPEEAFEVQIGLGISMTSEDVLDGIMRMTIKVAIVRPAEFIVITFMQYMKKASV